MNALASPRTCVKRPLGTPGLVHRRHNAGSDARRQQDGRSRGEAHAGEQFAADGKPTVFGRASTGELSGIGPGLPLNADRRTIAPLRLFADSLGQRSSARITTQFAARYRSPGRAAAQTLRQQQLTSRVERCSADDRSIAVYCALLH